VAAFDDIKQTEIALRILNEFYLKQVPPGKQDALPGFWAAYLGGKAGPRGNIADSALLPHRLQEIAVLRHAANAGGADAGLYLANVLFHLGRYSEARELWQKSASGSTQPVLAFRALGMAARTVDADFAAARQWLEQASKADPGDAIVARDLARLLFEAADKQDSDADKRTTVSEARDKLKAAFPAGKGRSDFVALLARAQNRLGDYADTARMLDQVRVTVWEGAHEVHDLFQDAHLALGEAHLKEGRAAEALAEFNRALEYPENLATGKLENAREAHIQYLRGNALSALGRKQEAAVAWKLAADEPESRDPKLKEARRKAKEALEAGQ
jgi:tetratricopeptide (TPR) repeat protein